MSYANILGPDGKISPAYLPSGGVATTLAAVCAQGNQTGSTGIVLGDGTAGNRQSIENVSEMDIVTLKVQQIEAYDPLLFPQVGVAADLVFADGTALEFEGDAVLNVPSGELKVTGIDDSSAAPLTNVLAYNTSTGEITYQPVGAGASTVNSVTNSDGSVTVSPTIGNVVVSLPATGSAGTYSYPTSLTTDAKGRVTAVTAGSAPTLSSVLTAGNVASDNIQMGGNDITDAGAVKALTVQISGTGGSLEMNSLPINNSRNVGTQLSKVGNNLMLLDAGGTQLGSAVALPSTPSLGDVLSVGAVASTNIDMNSYNLSNAVTVNTTNLTSSEAEAVPLIHIKNRVIFDGASANEKILNMGGSGQITDCAVVSSGVGGMLLKASGTDGVQVSTSGGGAGILSTGTVRPHPAGVGSWTSESCASLGSELTWNEGTRTLTLQSQTGATLGSGVVISGGGGATPGLADVLAVSNSAGANDINVNSRTLQNVNKVQSQSSGVGNLTVEANGGMSVKTTAGLPASISCSGINLNTGALNNCQTISSSSGSLTVSAPTNISLTATAGTMTISGKTSSLLRTNGATYASSDGTSLTLPLPTYFTGSGALGAGYVLTDVTGDGKAAWAPAAGGTTPTLAQVLTQSNDANNLSITDVNTLSAATVSANTVSSVGDLTVTTPAGGVILKTNGSNKLVVGATTTQAYQNLVMNGSDITGAGTVGTTTLETSNFTLDQASSPGYVLTDVAGTGVGVWAPATGGGGSVTSVSAGTGVTVTGTAADPIVNADVADIVAGTNISVSDNGSGVYTISAAPGSSGSLANYYLYTADANTQTPPPTAGKVVWSNATQINSGLIYLSHLTADNVDVEVLFNLYIAGDTLIVQDQNDSTNYQKYTIQLVTITTNSQIALAVTYNAGAAQFTNNHALAVIVYPSGSGAGIQGITAGTGILIDSSTPTQPVVINVGTLGQALTNGANALGQNITNLNSITANTTTGNDFTITTTNANKIQLRTQSTAALTIDNSQRTGLGTAAPTARLEVNGDIKLTSVSDKLIGNVQGNVQGNLQGNADTATTATTATTAETATNATNVSSAGAGIVFNTAASTTSLSAGLGSANQLVQSTGSGLTFVNPSALTVGSATTAGTATFATSAGTASSATSATTATTATNLSSAGTGVPYQSAANTTAVQAFGTSQQLLRMNVAEDGLEWVSPASLNVGSATSANTANTATNLAGVGGVGGRLLYQTGTNTTSILAAGTSGQLLQLVGNVPAWRNALVFNVLGYTATANPIAGGANTTILGTTSSAQFTPSSTSGLFDFTAAISLTGGGSYTPGTWRLQVLANTNSSFATGNITLFNGIPTYADFTTIQFSSRGLPAGLTAGSNYFIRISIVLAPTITGTLTATIPNSNFIFYAN